MITATLVTNFANDSNLSSYSTGSVSPSSNVPLLLLVASERNSGGDPGVPTISALGLTWTQVASIQEGSPGTRRLTIFRAQGTVTPGVITANFGMEQTTCAIQLVQLGGDIDKTASGANTVVQSNTNQAAGTNSGVTVSLSTFSDVNNATLGVVYITNAAVAISPGSGFTELGETGGGSSELQSEFKNTNDTSVDWSWSSGSRNAIAIAVELKYLIPSQVKKFMGVTQAQIKKALGTANATAKKIMGVPNT